MFDESCDNGCHKADEDSSKPVQFHKVKSQILNAPTDGTRTNIYIEGSVDWMEEVVISEGQNIYLIGNTSDGNRPELKACHENRHIRVDKGGTFSAENIVFKQGFTEDEGGSIFNDEGVIQSLVSCTFLHNSAVFGVQYYQTEATFFQSLTPTLLKTAQISAGVLYYM